MSRPDPKNLTPTEAADLVQQYGGIRAASKRTGYAFGTLRNRYQTAVNEGRANPQTIRRHDEPGARPEDALDGRIEAIHTQSRKLPRSGRVARYLLTCAQNNTAVFTAGWDNLMALKRFYNAELLVSRFTYNKSAYGKGSVKPGTSNEAEQMWFDDRIVPYIADQRIEIAPGLVWCGEINILPTAKRPLSGFETYTGRKSAIIPHTRVAMESVPSMKFEPTKFNYTTGTVTLRNYIQKKAGQVADFHHSYAALLVEVDSEGDWFCRQIHMDSEGTIYDLDVRANGGVVTRGHPVEAICWGDIHAARLNPVVMDLAWGASGMMDALRPAYQFMHDVFDMRARNHHERSNPHKLFQRHVEGEDSVDDELDVTAEVLRQVRAPYCQTVVVDSNHDNALEKWLRETTPHADPANAIIWHHLSLMKYKAIQRQDRDHHLLEEALRERGCNEERFLRADESFIICPDRSGGVECGMHGHRGPNGMRGSANAFAKLGRKANTGHTHSAGILDGIYVAGLSADLDMEYNEGPSSWSHSHVVTYKNGKRAIVTMWNGKWRANEDL